MKSSSGRFPCQTPRARAPAPHMPIVPQGLQPCFISRGGRHSIDNYQEPVLQKLYFRGRGRKDKAGTNVSRRTSERQHVPRRSRAKEDWACGTRRARNGAPHARGYTLLKQARGTKARNRIHDRNRLPLKNPAGHRIAQGRIANIDQLHGSPQ
jgi:hypothetical protein